MNFITLLLIILGAGVKGPFTGNTTVENYNNSYLLLLENETIDTRITATQSLQEGHRFIVKFNHPPLDYEKSLLANSELKIESYLPHYAYLVSGEGSTVSRLLSEQSIVWAGRYEPRYKIAPVLLSGETSTDLIHIWLFDDADVSRLAQVLVERFDAVINSTHEGLNKTLLVSVNPEQVAKIAKLDEVRWIEPFYPPSFHNDRAQWVLQSWEPDNRSLWDRGLDGSGVVTCTGDAGLTTTHVMFCDSNVVISTWGDYPTHRKVIAYQPSAPAAEFGDMASESYHGTHTAGTVCGNDAYWNETSTYDGMAPGAKIYFIDVGSSYSIAYPSDYNDMYTMPWEGNEGGRAKLMSNSWGSGGAYRSYDIPSRQTDEFMWNHPDFLIFYSAGNSGTSGVSPPATAKNVVAVGATSNGTSATTPAGFSSEGPTSDERIKPTLTAPGYLVSADGGTTDGYHELFGTSMSCPAAAGACASIIQYLQEGWYPSGAPTFSSQDSINPSAALMKAMLISSTIADFSGYSIPDPKIGWGRICLDSVLYFAGEENRLYLNDNTLGIEGGEEAVYTVDVTGNDWPLRATLVWTDFPGDMAALKKIVNDLDLEACSPSGETYLGNVFANNFSEQGGDKDDINVEECLRIKNPEEGTWTIKVRGANVPEGPQSYALVLTGMMDVAEPQLKGSGVRIDDSANSDPNNALDPAETAILYPRILNTGEDAANAVEAILRSDDPMVTIDTSSASYGDIESGTYAEGEGFEVTLDPTAQPGDQISFFAIATTAGGSKVDTINFPIIVGVSGIKEEGERTLPLLSCPAILGDEARIFLSLSDMENVSLVLYDACGRKVEEIVTDLSLKKGTHSFQLQAPEACGVYFLSLQAGRYKKLVKIVRLN